MKHLILFLLCLLSAGSAVAQDSYLCIADHSTGFAFDKNSKQWSTSGFKSGNKYLISRSKQPGYVWEVKNFGETDTLAACKGDFNDVGVIYCEGFETFRFSRRNLRFLSIYALGYWNDSVNSSGDKKSDIDRMFEEGKNTPGMSIGKCSPL